MRRARTFTRTLGPSARGRRATPRTATPSVGTDAHGNPLASTSPIGLSPPTIKTVYSFPTSSTAGAGKTIAIVDAYDDPTAESDLNVFS